jgi:hypothetical protein
MSVLLDTDVFPLRTLPAIYIPTCLTRISSTSRQSLALRHLLPRYPESPKSAALSFVGQGQESGGGLTAWTLTPYGVDTVRACVLVLI